MNQFRRLFWLLTLCAFVSGCSGYRLAALPSDDPAAPAGQAVEIVGTGQMVRVALRSGEVVTGRVASIDDDTLVLAARTEGRDERELAAGDIESVSVRRTEGALKGATGTVLVAGALGLLTYLILDPGEIFSDDPR